MQNFIKKKEEEGMDIELDESQNWQAQTFEAFPFTKTVFDLYTRVGREATPQILASYSDRMNMSLNLVNSYKEDPALVMAETN